MRRILPSLLASVTVLVVLVPACGGGNGSPRTNRPPSPSPAPQNPCAAAADEAFDEPALPETPSRKRGRRLDGDPRGNVYGSLWLHRAARGGRDSTLDAGPLAVVEDVGDIAVVQDRGDLFIPPNPFDLAGLGLRFAPSGGGYQVSRVDAAFRASLGARLELDDDDSEGFDLPFPFSFYGRPHGRVFVNSDGNITFEEEDRASTERNVPRLLGGPPRVAPFFADLDPTMGGGRVYAASAGDAFTVTWCNVRGFDRTESVTVQATLLPDGAVEVRFGSAITLPGAIVGVSPGRTSQFAPLDLSAPAPAASGAVATGERFAGSIDLDSVAVARAFYGSHADSYDQLVIWTDVRVTTDAFAYETTVANRIRGVGLEIFDESRSFGSDGRLHSLVVMDALGKYPADPQAPVLGENSTVSLIGQEVGHRWLAFLRFRDHDGAESDDLLGRDDAHWSFFMDSDASVMEGNDIEELGGGRFRTRAAVSRYSLLDQYAMGLVGESQVPPFFYVESPVNVTPEREPDDGPEVGVTFSGTKRTVLIQDVIAVMGPRQPSFRDSPRVLRQAFVYVVSNGRAIDAGQVAKLDGIRRQWEPFFSRAVDGRARAETRLRPPS